MKSEENGFILQEYDHHPIAGWRNLSGTVRNTIQEARQLLKEFQDGKGYSPYKTGMFRIQAI